MNNNLIIDNIYFADILAGHYKKKLTFVNYDELQSAAYLGLVEAANKFNASKNKQFKSFAKFRIIGAIRDYLREINWGSRRNPIKMSDLQS